MSHNKWPHEAEDYPIKCRECKYSEDLGRFIACTQYGSVFMRHAELKKCDWYHEKGGNDLNAEETQSPPESSHLEEGRESTQEKQNTNAGRH